MYMFICECGKEFETERSMWSHQAHCDVHKSLPKTNKHTSKYKIADNKYKCECGREFDNFQSLNAHFSHCDFHHKCNGTVRKGHATEITKSMHWENKTENELQQIRAKAGKTHSMRIKNGELNPSFLNKKHSNESKEKIRQSTIKYISDKCVVKFTPRYSKNGCQYIDKLNEEKCWNLQHAENGGEINIFGYFVDGYDEKRNIVFEYDEPNHYVDKENNILCNKDIERQKYIYSKLKCEFWRYNEYLDLLYKVY